MVATVLKVTTGTVPSYITVTGSATTGLNLVITPSLTETTGTFSIKVGLYDATNPVVYYTFQLTIVVNNAPSFTGTVASFTIAQGFTSTVSIPAYSDADSDTMTLSIV